MNSSSIRGHSGSNIRNSRCTHPDRVRRREEAKVRQAAYDKLTIKQKIDGLIPGGSTRQRARLR
jgi:hypothetical protein